jgi:glyoxylase-like metal-dependent hydrolase (beta-lactamase superfamily II)
MSPAPLPTGVRVLERGWLSSNNVLIDPGPGEAGATLIDTSHVNHAEQTVQLVRHALSGAPLGRVVNTHLHSDHCGGNATLERAYGVRAIVPATLAEAVSQWDRERLSHASTDQACERFGAGSTLAPGDMLAAGGRHWQALAAPGHDPDSLVFFEEDSGTLISADALWENGFGVVFPELDGDDGFDDVEATLEQLAALPVRLVIPGHGAPFVDAAAALARARARLAAFRSDPSRHARHAVKVFLKYHLMEVRRQPYAGALRWAAGTPSVGGLWQRFGRGKAASAEEWVGEMLDELVRNGSLARDGELLLDA